MDERDPFTSAPSGHTHHRFGNFDSQMFALGPGVSADQAKRALEAHLAETDRRMEEAGKVGAALVDQHKTLTEKLKEVEKLQAEDELSPELRLKLVEIEKDYTDVARESARVFLPKSRVPSNETVVAGSPFAPEGKGGRRSVSPSKFESHGTGSPTKLGVPNRKLRNQPSNRVHDIEFAAEISTSLIAQVRSLQGLLSEKEEEVRDLKVEKSQLEIEAEGFQQRVRTLDESEHRYKDENWNLETQIRELLASQKDAADREKKLGQNLTILQAEKNAALRELDEVKLAHAKLTEDQAAAAKHHDVELGAAKRSIAMAENERSTMQRKLDDLTNQNQELAKAFSMQRGRTLERDGQSGLSEDDFDTATDNNTPEHSPPPSPVKGTPRHSMLESETLRTSFQHLQRQLQLMRSNLHREKTEKLELRRILQESRDEVERLRLKGGDHPGSAQSKRTKKTDSKDFKKPRPAQLGALRIPRNEILTDDPDWEDTNDSPSRSTSRISPISRGSRGSGDVFASRPAPVTSESEVFQTANETSDAFETANERGGTETDDFQTGAEEFSGEDTETESVTRGPGRHPSVIPINLGQRSRGESFHSTASTSAEEDEYPTTELRTPTVFPVPHKMRLKVSRSNISRRSRQASEEPQLASSPASFLGSMGGTPQGQQSLFAELGDLEVSDDDLINTPSRRSVRSMTPASIYRERTASPPPAIPPMPRVMVDSGSQTDQLAGLGTHQLSIADSGAGSERLNAESPPTSPVSEVTAQRPRTMESAIDTSKRLTVGTLDSDISRPLSSVYSDSGSQFDPEIERKLSLFPAPPLGHQTILPPAQTMVVSSVESYIDIAPIVQQEKPPPELVLSAIASEAVTPVAEKLLPPPELTLSAVASEVIEPKAEPEVPPPDLTVSQVVSEQVEPVAEPVPEAPLLSISILVSEQVEPIAEPVLEAPPLSISTLVSEGVEPIPMPEIPLPALSISSVVAEEVSPIAALEPPKADAPELSLSSVASQGIAPVEVPAPVLTMSGLVSEGVVPIPSVEPTLQLSNIVSEGVDPIAPVQPTLKISHVISEGVEPIKPESPVLALSSLVTEDTEPVEVQPVVPNLSMSALVSEALAPVSRPATPKPDLAFSRIQAEAVSPVIPPVQRPVAPPLAISNVTTMAATSPVSPRSPRRDGFIIPRDMNASRAQEPHTPTEGLFDVFRKNKGPATPIIAEDETRQSPNNTPRIETPESQRPLKEMNNNSPVRPPRKGPTPIVSIDNGAQTALTSEELDKLIAARGAGPMTPEKGVFGLGAMASTMGNTPSTVRRRPSEDSVGSVIRHKGKGVNGEHVLLDNLHHRPGSSSSTRGAFADMPPLPPNHREVIEAARTGSSHGGIGSMGPPLLPASAYKNPSLRPRTPTSPSKAASATVSGRETPTPRAGAGHGPSHGVARIGSPNRLTERSRQSSVTSFASELDTRFHLQGAITPHGFAPGTDPRMIQAITQTMIGEYLWKYTRKTASSNMSQTRHRRYFWVHPYTRTLYWSDRDPSMPGSRSEGRTKSVQIEAVRVVTDDNPYPPGLHRKSLVVIAPGRTVKFTCQTGQRHETWFNALSYLLLRTNDGQHDAEQLAENITQEDVDEFNPAYNQRHANGNRPLVPPSLSSYNSRPSETTSPAFDASVNVPTLTPNRAQKQATQRPSMGSLTSRISGYWKAGTFSSLRTRGATAQSPSIYEASEVHDSAEDLRHIIQQQDREADRLENVRACCEGKHDVGTLTNTKRGRPHAHHHPHSHPGNMSTIHTPTSTLRSRA